MMLTVRAADIGTVLFILKRPKDGWNVKTVGKRSRLQNVLKNTLGFLFLGLISIAER